VKQNIDNAKQEITRALNDTYHVEGDDYAKTLSKTRKHLPRKLAKDAEYLMTAERQLKHPKLRKRVDHARVDKARRGVLQSTKGVDIDRQRSYARFAWLSGLVLRLIVAMVGIFGAAKYFGAY